MLFSLQMQPTLSHVPQRLLECSFGQTARPKASPKCLQDSRPRPTWLSTDSGDRDQNAFPTYRHVQTYFRPSIGGIQKHGAVLPHISFILAGFRGPAQRFGRWQFWDLYKKNTIASKGRQASKARGRPGFPCKSNRKALAKHQATLSLAQERTLATATIDENPNETKRQTKSAHDTI